MMRMLTFGLAFAWTASVAPQASAQVSPVIPSPSIGPQIGGIQQPPYGPGFNGQVIVGPRDGCRNTNCPRTGLQNRPAHRRYYDHYFDVPQPVYPDQHRIGGNRALGPALPLQQSCAAQYRSYRASDNTFQPFEGPRRPCRL